MKRWKRHLQYVPIIVALVVVICVIAGYLCIDVEQKVTLKAEKEVYPLGVTDISCTLYNASIELVRYYTYYSLERLVDGEWESIDDVMLNLRDDWLGGRLRALSSRQLSFHVGYYSYLSEPFDYRIKIRYTTEHYSDLLKGNGIDTEHNAYCYFSVE